MHTEKRQHAAGMIEHLRAAPQRYRFAQLLNILVRMLRQQGIPYDQAFGRVLRFRNSLSLAFPASEIESMQVEPDAAAGAPRIHITPAFIGLLGASGALPLNEIALMCGFSSASHFTHRFRQAMGATPGEYRQAFCA